MPVCPAAQKGVDVPEIMQKFCEEDFYKEDYQAITSYFTADYVTYEDARDEIWKLAISGLF
jgi:hypothetical protein